MNQNGNKQKQRETEAASPRPQQRVVGVPRGYKRAAAQMDDIASQFKNGASMTRLSHKHSLRLEIVEGIIRMKLLGHSNKKVSNPDAENPKP